MKHTLVSSLLISLLATTAMAEGQTATAIFAGGCFWCMEPPFDKLEGVLETTSGYTGGHLDNPTYKQVSAGGTGHYEAVRITYDPNKINYSTLLYVFWHNIDPLDAGGQFCDRGNAYRSAIFYLNEEQQAQAEESRQALIQTGPLAGTEPQKIATAITAATTFYPAENYHQNYYKKNPIRYKYYRWGCGRDQRLEELWGEQDGH